MKIANEESRARLFDLAQELAEAAGVQGPGTDADPRAWIENHIAEMADHVQMAHRTRMDQVLTGSK
jgi:hypothetical protein